MRPMCSRIGLIVVVFSSVAGHRAFGVTIDDYQLTSSFQFPVGAGPFDALPDGRLVVLVGADVHREVSPAARSFALLGTLPGADLPGFGAAFLRVSPDGTRLAVGNNGGASFGNFQVGVFDAATLSGTWFDAGHFEGRWFDDTWLALTDGDFVSPSVVTLLDTTSPNPSGPINPIVIDGIGGGSAGVAFDSAGRLITGNGFFLFGPSGTGTIKSFAFADWQAVLSGGTPLDFETQGVFLADLLSAAPLGMDDSGHLLVGGGDFGDDFDFAALVSGGAIQDALMGGGPALLGDPSAVRTLDPDTVNGFNFYDVNYIGATGELVLFDRSGSTAFTYSASHVNVPLASVAGTVWTCVLLGWLGVRYSSDGRRT